MIDLYFWTTPNGHKITMFLEEAAVPYRIVPVDIGHDAQFAPSYLAIAPNNKMPAIVDHEPAGGGAPISIFESGAILLYLAEKTGQFVPKDLRGRTEVLQWLVWQVAGLGPMAGQYGHFTQHAKEKVPYAIERYTKEFERLHRVLDKHLADREYIAGDYSIADMAVYPWTASNTYRPNAETFPNTARWIAKVAARPATVRAYERGNREVDAVRKPARPA